MCQTLLIYSISLFLLQGNLLNLMELPKRKRRELTDEEKEERRKKVNFPFAFSVGNVIAICFRSLGWTSGFNQYNLSALLQASRLQKLNSKWCSQLKSSACLWFRAQTPHNQRCTLYLTSWVLNFLVVMFSLKLPNVIPMHFYYPLLWQHRPPVFLKTKRIGRLEKLPHRC